MWSPSCSAVPDTRHLWRDAASSSTDVVSPHVVLIFSADAMAAALLGAAVELAGYAPQFPQAGEAARAALRRAHPGVVLVDCDHSESCADAFVGPALMTGARVILFRSRHTRTAVNQLGQRLAIPVLELPADAERLRRLLDGTPDV
jgi:DNA-binding NtrC family response regulator